MNFFKKNHTTTKKITTHIVRFIFDGWSTEEQGQKWKKSINIWEPEATKGRTDISMEGIFQIRLLTPEHPTQGTLPGSLLEVLYDSLTISPDQIQDCFTNSGILVHKANPFDREPKGVTAWFKNIFIKK